MKEACHQENHHAKEKDFCKDGACCTENVHVEMSNCCAENVMEKYSHCQSGGTYAKGSVSQSKKSDSCNTGCTGQVSIPVIPVNDSRNRGEGGGVGLTHKIGRSRFYIEKICCASEIPAIRSIVDPIDGVSGVMINVTTKMVSKGFSFGNEGVAKRMLFSS